MGLILFSDQIELFIPPKKGKSHVLRIIRELLEFSPKSKKTDLAFALKYLTNVMKKKAIVFVLSDFITDDYLQTLRITGKKHDLTGMQMEDAETGKLQLVNTQSKKVRLNYGKFYQERVDYFQTTFSKSGCGVLNCRVDESYVKKLLGYFKRRG
mgnify:CR=1 FL=1